MTKAQARANRRGLKHSSDRHFAVPQRGVRQVRALLFPQFVSAQKWEHERMNAPSNQQQVASTFGELNACRNPASSTTL